MKCTVYGDIDKEFDAVLMVLLDENYEARFRKLVGWP
jgi:hypothetical protein